jgi:large exoprotein involved in heme utilization and adhesion
VPVKTTGIYAQSNPGDSAAVNVKYGDGGTIQIEAKDLTLANGGVISATTFGSGSSGDIAVSTGGLDISGSKQLTINILNNKREVIRSGTTLQRSGIYSAVGDAPVDNVYAGHASAGPGGTITVDSADFSISRGGVILASTYGTGKGGDIDVTSPTIRIDATGTGVDDKTGIFAQAGVDVSGQATGNGGRIGIQADDLLITNGGIISTATFGSGASGDIDIHTGRFTIQNLVIGGVTPPNVSTLEAKADPKVKGLSGNITITCDDFSLLGRSK